MDFDMQCEREVIDRAKEILADYNAQLQCNFLNTLFSVSKYEVDYDDQQKWETFLIFNKQHGDEKIYCDEIIRVLNLFDFSYQAVNDIKKLYYEV